MIAEKAVSSFKDGIETVVVPITHAIDLQDLVFHSKRGGTHDVVEWLLSQLYRPREIERVCGLTVTPLYEGVVQINLELRQPGRQIELWLREHGSLFISPNGVCSTAEDMSDIGKLSGRALAQAKFTDQYKPWWEGEQHAALTQVDGYAATHSLDKQVTKAEFP